MAGFNLLGSLSYTPVDGAGQPYAGALLYVYRAGTTTATATYTTAALSVANPHPVVADGNGRFANVWVDDAVAYDYRVRITDANGVQIPGADWDNIPRSGLTTAKIGELLYPRSTIEQSLSVTPTNYAYPVGDVRRYGAVGNGSTDDTSAIQTAINVCWVSSDTVTLPQGVFSVTGLTLTVPPANRDRVLRMRGAGYGEPFALTQSAGTVIKRTTDGPVLSCESSGTAGQSTGTIDIEGIYFDGDSSTAVVYLEAFYGLSRFRHNAIYQRGTGNGLQIDYGATYEVEHNYVINGDFVTFSLFSARTGIGIYLRSQVDAGLAKVRGNTSRGFLTAYKIGDASAHYMYSALIEANEASVVYNGFHLTSDCRSAIVKGNYLEGGEGGIGILDEGDYNRTLGNFVFSGFATGIDLTASTKGNVCRDNVIAAASVANSKLIKVSDSGSGKVVSNNHLSFGGSGGSVAGVVGITISGTAPVLDMSGNTFDPSGAWTGGAGTAKISDTSTSGGVIGLSITEDTSGYAFPLLSRGVISFGEGPTLADAAVTTNTLAFGAGGYFVVTCTSPQTITALSGPSLPDCRVVTFRTTNSNATFTDATNLQTAGGATFSGPGVIQFLIDSGVAYELGRTVL